MNTSQKILFDVDSGVDDAIAIMMALKSPFIDVLGITTTYGNTTVIQTTKNTLKVLDYLKKQIPVVMGASEPLKGKNVSAELVHGSDGLGNSNIPEPISKPLIQDTTEFLWKTIQRNPSKVTIVALGPLTNIAKLFIDKPKSIEQIKQLIIMGGTRKIPGMNPSKCAEFNMYNDPFAAQIVMQSKVKKIIVPLDVTDKVFLTSSDVRSLSNTITKEGTLLYELSTYWRENFSKTTPRFILWDPVALGAFLWPSIYRFKKIDIHVETNNKERSGELLMSPPLENNTFLATNIRAKEFISFFKQLIS